MYQATSVTVALNPVWSLTEYSVQLKVIHQSINSHQYLIQYSIFKWIKKFLGLLVNFLYSCKDIDIILIGGEGGYYYHYHLVDLSCLASVLAI